MKNKTRLGLIIAVIVLVFLISGCVQRKCGDGICQRWEEKKAKLK